MRLTFLKVDTTQTDGGFLISVAPGELRFATKDGEVALAEPLQLEMVTDDKGHKFENILRYVVFEGQGLAGQVMQGSVFSIVTHEDFEQALYRAMRECKVVPFMRLVDERALYSATFAVLSMMDMAHILKYTRLMALKRCITKVAVNRTVSAILRVCHSVASFFVRLTCSICK